MKPPIAPRARCGLDKITTEITKVPRVRLMTVDGVKGIWIPLHPLTDLPTRKR